MVELGVTFSSPENPAMFQEVLHTQLPISQSGKYSALRNVEINCLVGFTDSLVPPHSSVIEQLYMARQLDKTVVREAQYHS